MAETEIREISREFADKVLSPPNSLYRSLRPPEYAPTFKIDEKSTVVYQVRQQTNQIIEKSNEQIRLLNEHNKQLTSNYKKLEELYNLKSKELEEAKQEAEKTKKYNTKMLVIALVSAGIALASLVATILIAVL